MFVTDPGSDGPGIKTKVIQFADAAGSLLELFQDSSEFWNLRGMKLFKVRRRIPEPLDNGLRVLDHSRFIADALRRDLQLPKTPEAFEVPVRADANSCLQQYHTDSRQILYGNPNPTSQFLNISQVGPISVTVKQNIPSSLARLGKPAILHCGSRPLTL